MNLNSNALKISEIEFKHADKIRLNSKTPINSEILEPVSKKLRSHY